MSLTTPGSDERQPKRNLSPSSPLTPEVENYDSDCLVIIEGEDDPPPPEVTEVTTSANETTARTTVSSSPASLHNDNNNNNNPEQNNNNNKSKRKNHNLPIYELKKKLAYCPVCKVQFRSHKAANLCLSKHGKRQCWLCLDVMANSKDSYFQHCVQNHAVGPSSDIVGCPYCHKFFDFRQGFNQHIVKVHFSEDISFVSSTACLSPASLVDLYTGQPRRRSSSLDYGSKFKSGNSISNSSSAEDRSSELEEIPLNPSIDGVGGFVSLGGQTRTNVTRESVIRETPTKLTNSTAPVAQLPYPSLAQPPLSNLFLNQHHQLLSNSNNILIWSGIEEGQTHHQQHRPQSYPQVTSTTSSDTIPRTPSSKSTYVKTSSGFIRIGSSSLSGSETGFSLPQRSKSSPSVPTLMNYPTPPAPPISRTDPHGTQAYHQMVQNGQVSSAPDSSDSAGYFETMDPPSSKSSEGPSSPVGSISPSLLEMQRMVQSSQVQIQYFNSVNSMLRTVAECGPGPNNFSTSFENLSDGSGSCRRDNNSNLQYVDNRDPHPSHPTIPDQDNFSSSNTSNHPENSSNSNSQSDMEVFKVPMNVGVKRRILTKWDEHQEKETGDMSGGPIRRKVHCHQSSSRGDCSSTTGSTLQGLTHNGQFQQRDHNMSSEDHRFWEQVIRESTAMYKGLNTPSQLEYPSKESYQNHQNYHHHHHHQKSIQSHDLQVQTTSTESGESIKISSNYSSERSQHYPRIMARVDSTGRSMGVFTSDGQPCLLSTNRACKLYPNPDLNNEPMTQSHFSHVHSRRSHSHSGQTHRQYQYKIIPQASGSVSSTMPLSKGSMANISNTSGGGSECNSSRKRKSSIPIRVVPNPHYDSVVVQNPFEEDIPSPKVPNLSQGQSSSQASYRSAPGGQTLEAARGQALAQWEALVIQRRQQYQPTFISSGGRLHHFQPNFNAGGQMTEFPLQQHEVRVQGSKSSKGENDPSGSLGRISSSSKRRSNSISSHSISSSKSSSLTSNLLSSKDNSPQQQLGSIRHSLEGQFTFEETPLEDRDLNNNNNNNSTTNNNSMGWPPFVVAPRYQEHCHTILNRLRDLDRQRRVDIDGNSDI